MPEKYQIGQIVEGRTGSYSFKGGDPKDKNNWELVSYPGVSEKEPEISTIEQPKTSMGEALQLTFPSTTKGRGLKGKAGGLVSDITSSPGRLGSAMDRMLEYARAATPEEKEQKRKEIELAFKGESPGFARSMVESSELGSAAIAAPFTGGLSAKGVLGKMGAGAIEGGAAAIGGQGKRLAEKGEISPTEAAVEVGLSTAMPLGGSLTRKAGEALLRPIMKPVNTVKRELKKKGIDLGKDIFKKVFGKEITSAIPGMGGLKQMESRALKAEKEVLKKYDSIVQQNSNVEIDVEGAFERTVAKLQEQMGKGKHLDVSDKFPNIIKKWDNKLFQEGKQAVDLQTALEVRKGLDKMAKWEFDDKPTKSMLAEARFARAFRKELNNSEIHAKVPDLIQVDQTLANGYPIQHALEDAIERIGNNSPISLTDVIILGSMVGGGIGGEYGNVPGLSEGSGAAGLSLLLLNRARRSPTMATQLYKAGSFGESRLGRQLLARPAAQALKPEKKEIGK